MDKLFKQAEKVMERISEIERARLKIDTSPHKPVDEGRPAGDVKVGDDQS